MNNVIIIGDPHIGKSTNIGKAGVGSNLNSRIADQINLLDWSLDQAIENSVGNIIITGDVFDDPKPQPSLIAIFISWLKKCQIYNINVHIIIGNHDVLRSGNIYSSPLDIITEADIDNVSVYKDINTIFIGVTAFTLLPFKDRKSLNTNSNACAISLIRNSLVYEFACIPATYRKVLVGHLAIEGSIPIGDEIDDMNNELFCPINMFEGYDYVWMGHVHKPQVMNKNPLVAHIGSMDISNFGEVDQKKIIVIFNGDMGTFTTKSLPTRPLKKITISVPNDIKNTTEYVLNEVDKLGNVFDKSIVRIEVALSSQESKSISKSAIEKHILSKGAFNIAGIAESKKVSLIKRDANNILDTKMDVPSTIKSYCTTYITDNLQSSFVELSMDIYNTYKLEAKD
jgi:exonuclease SbcD